MGDGEVSAQQVERLVEKLGEVVVRLDAFILKVEENYLTRELYDLAHKQLQSKVQENNDRHDAEIAALEARQTLIARTAVTALLLPLITGVIVALLVGSFT